MTQSEAREIAEKLINMTDLRGHKYIYVDARKQAKTPDKWTVMFDLYSPDGDLLESPTFVFVDEKTGVARLFEGSL